MKKYFIKYSSALLVATLSLAGITFLSINEDVDQNKTAFDIKLSPWSSIGGCGAGGSGGGGGDGIKWVGQGVDGGMLQLEVMPKLSIGQNFRNITIAPRFQIKPTWSTTLGLTIPFVSKSGEIQYQTDLPANNRTTGGMGDMSLDFGWSTGPSGEYSLNLGLGLPTAQYDIARGPDASKQFLPASLQKGGGLYSLSAGIGYSKDVENGIWLFDASYSRPFAFKFKRENEFMDEYWQNYKDVDDHRFDYRFKFYGENDLGDYTPPSVTASVYYGYRGVAEMVHSFGVTYSMPLGVAWIHSPSTTTYDPFPDPDYQKWTAALVYGLEFSRDKFPLYIAVSLPLHDKSNTPDPYADKYDESLVDKWDGPDWEDFGQQWNIGIGFKSAMF